MLAFFHNPSPLADFPHFVVIASFFRRSPALCFTLAAALPLLPRAARATTFNTIHTFTAATDGNVTYPALVQGADGLLYGVNSTGGRSDNGTIFSLGLGGGSFTVLNTFTQAGQGTTPEGGLVQARDGNFYGTTNTGGNGGYGTLFQCVPGTGKLNILTQFTNGDPGGTPVGTLVEGADGFLYGTAEYGGSDNYGTVFRTNLSSSATITLAEITGGVAGYYPQSDLIQATDGNFYGTTEQGGTNNLGTFFQVTPAGVYTVIYSFTGGPDGSRPLRGVIQGRDGSFYGVTNQGGTYGGGAIYRIDYLNTTFLLTVLHDFYPILLDGSNPLSNLVQASDGNFYGTTAGGGANGDGTIYEVTSTGGYNLLYSFTDGTDGSSPVGALTQASDGNLYGTTAGTNGESGTVFRLNNGLAAPIPRPLFLSQSNAAVGDTILIKGDNFVGTTAVSFTGANGALIPSSSFSALSKTDLQAVVPAGAMTGVVYVTANSQTGTTPTALIVATVATAPTAAPVVSILANRPLASKADSTEGRFQVSRTGDTTQALTVSVKVRPKSTAIFGTDYHLTSKGISLALTDTVTIPAGKSKVAIKVIPVPSNVAEPASTVVIKVAVGNGYTLGSAVKATVQIISSSAGQ